MFCVMMRAHTVNTYYSLLTALFGFTENSERASEQDVIPQNDQSTMCKTWTLKMFALNNSL